MSEHVTPVRVYVLVFVALMVLTAITVNVAFLHLGPFNDVVALTIAVVKASLVVLYFMHARYAGGLTHLVIGASVAFYAILVFLTLSDYVTRSWALTGGS